MALYLQFGDSFWHPAHMRSITLGQIASITVNPDDLEAYFEACAGMWLNEPLHHWHKEFYNHDLQ
ncbi:uncharacterized protein BJ212DRAFT_1487090 [Suillus subaureus]|uniref:Uncharacterized protein n=1 Tax=Suillus subaureus TaxID=48587 RepID=A0A9P7J4U3_9AGAM|nr:uncharacterized protein BJ212DRAFT_1487090 [Suillus subaureus]KAG1803224.1 hypothetical protein BJ212DRAFT_1487090 [Suillus subaureus]